MVRFLSSWLKCVLVFTIIILDKTDNVIQSEHGNGIAETYG